jgi:hypothetical protein
MMVNIFNISAHNKEDEEHLNLFILFIYNKDFEINFL